VKKSPRKRKMRMLGVLCLLCLFGSAWSASWIVAAHDSSPAAKARADVVCNGTDDQIILRESLTKGPWVRTQYDDNAWTMAYSSQSVEWMAGTYVLSDTLVLPQVVDTALFAEGTVIHYTGPKNKDIVVLSGALRSRFNFGTIWSTSNGAALAMKSRQYSNPFMVIDMNIITFQGLQRVGEVQGGPVPPGIGLWIQRPFCVNQVTGTDIRGFTTGIFADDWGPRDGHTIGELQQHITIHNTAQYNTITIQKNNIK
jgi:hypothetical protein